MSLRFTTWWLVGALPSTAQLAPVASHVGSRYPNSRTALIVSATRTARIAGQFRRPPR